MQFIIINGSPRGRESNSEWLIQAFLKGFSHHNKQRVPVYYLVSKSGMNKAVAAFHHSRMALLFMPLYTDAMPGVVKDFIEKIHMFPDTGGRKLGFIVQSGFRESVHSEALEKYLQKLTLRLGCEYIGTVIRGGVEGVRMMPASMTKKLSGQFVMLGQEFAISSTFNESLLQRMRKPYRLNSFSLIMMRLACKIGLTNFYWRHHLRKYKALRLRDNRPFDN